jgi:uncharacterized protein (TIGR02996 family)
VVDEREFLAAIVAHPHDWGPRLVFADWLEERGDRRGELIRLLHELTRPKCTYRKRKEQRLHDLLRGGVEPVAPRITNDIGMEFVAIPPGSFLMGSPADEPGRWDDETQHQVTLTRGFFLARHPVTVGQWLQVMDPNHCTWTDPALPVGRVTRIDAARFIDRLRERDHRPYRFPTEAEWEFACRAGTTSAYFTGPTITAEQANVNLTRLKRRSRRGRAAKQPLKVGLFPPNALGLCDMHGCMWEWCADVYATFTAEPQVDPLVAPGPGLIVLKGGSWWNEPNRARSAARVARAPITTANAVGVRLCMAGE